jgi:hypothetical protein
MKRSFCHLISLTLNPIVYRTQCYKAPVICCASAKSIPREDESILKLCGKRWEFLLAERDVQGADRSDWPQRPDISTQRVGRSVGRSSCSLVYFMAMYQLHGLAFSDSERTVVRVRAVNGKKRKRNRSGKKRGRTEEGKRDTEMQE